MFERQIGRWCNTRVGLNPLNNGAVFELTSLIRNWGKRRLNPLNNGAVFELLKKQSKRLWLEVLIPLITGQCSNCKLHQRQFSYKSLNPLNNGAVFEHMKQAGSDVATRVLIPLITGQCSNVRRSEEPEKVIKS